LHKGGGKGEKKKTRRPPKEGFQRGGGREPKRSPQLEPGKDQGSSLLKGRGTKGGGKGKEATTSSLGEKAGVPLPEIARRGKEKKRKKKKKKKKKKCIFISGGKEKKKNTWKIL